MIKLPIGCLLLCIITLTSEAQFFYKDLVVSQETTDRWKSYKTGGVKAVTLISTEADSKPTEGFLGEQEVAADFTRITTHTKSPGTADAWIITDYDPQGRILKNTDTSDTYQNISEYRYDGQGRITTILDTSLETDNHFKEIEVHVWTYSPVHPDKPLSMLKIRDSSDTTYVRFVLDDKGNVTEEHARRKGEDIPSIFYYYDSDNRLTDIVRYSTRARRLLPMDIFEYEDGKLSSSLIVPKEGNSFYQKWYYVYDGKGLKAKDFCYNKEKELLGSIEYQYSYK